MKINGERFADLYVSSAVLISYPFDNRNMPTRGNG